jgi:hypothetical protein
MEIAPRHVPLEGTVQGRSEWQLIQDVKRQALQAPVHRKPYPVEPPLVPDICYVVKRNEFPAFGCLTGLKTERPHGR